MTLIGYLTRTHFAEAAIEDALPEEVGDLRRAMVVTDGEPSAAEALLRVRAALPEMDFTFVEFVPGLPSRDRVKEIIQHIEVSDICAIMAVGGCRAIGQARLIAEKAARCSRTLTLIGVPTSISDFGLARQVRLAAGGAVACPRPDSVIADPTVLAQTPPRQLAAAGLKILVNAMEAYASPSYNPPADGMALEAVRRLAEWLPLAVASPDHGEARRELMAAALTGGLALEKAVGGVDALAHPIETELGAGGVLHAPLLAAVVAFNQLAVGDRYGTLADAMGSGQASSPLGLRLGGLARRLGMPTTLQEAGVNRASFARFADHAANDPSALANPRRLTVSDCHRILEAAW